MDIYTVTIVTPLDVYKRAMATTISESSRTFTS